MLTSVDSLALRAKGISTGDFTKFICISTTAGYSVQNNPGNVDLECLRTKTNETVA